MITSWPVSRSALNDFCNQIEEENPGFEFDMTHMDKFKEPNLWFIDILSNEETKRELLSEIYDPNAMSKVYSALKGYLDEHKQIEWL